jgi:hypothetical protein
LTGNKVTLGLGQSATCSIVNDDDAPTVNIEAGVAVG